MKSKHPTSNSSFLKVNRGYFIGAGLFLVGGLIFLLFVEKGETVLYFANHRTEFWNSFFKIATMLGEEYIYLIGIIILLFIKIRYAILLPALGGLVALFSNLLKISFRHPRPAVHFGRMNELDSLNALDGIYLNVGLTSFPSGHTFSAFAAMSFLAFFLPQKGFKYLLLLLAILTGISRVYLAQHFIQDIIFGSFLGLLLSSILYYLQNKYLSDSPNLWYNKRLTFSKKSNQKV